MKGGDDMSEEQKLLYSIMARITRCMSFNGTATVTDGTGDINISHG